MREMIIIKLISILIRILTIMMIIIMKFHFGIWIYFWCGNTCFGFKGVRKEVMQKT